ncbi:MAG: 50S ribosomal protein L10 [Nitriliruptorales bacterium]
MATPTAPEREPRAEKVAVVERVRNELNEHPATLFTDYRGLSVTELAELRAKLREAGARHVVAKNTLVRIAANEAGFEELDEILVGPTALTFCREDPVAPAKAIRSFAKDHPELVMKGAILEGRFIDAETAAKLADLESREELVQKLAGLMYAALSSTASLLQAPISQLARLMAALEDKGGAAGEEPAAEAAGEPEAEPAEEEPAAEAAEEPEAEDDETSEQ